MSSKKAKMLQKKAAHEKRRQHEKRGKTQHFILAAIAILAGLVTILNINSPRSIKQFPAEKKIPNLKPKPRPTKLQADGTRARNKAYTKFAQAARYVATKSNNKEALTLTKMLEQGGLARPQGDGFKILQTRKKMHFVVTPIIPADYQRRDISRNWHRIINENALANVINARLLILRNYAFSKVYAGAILIHELKHIKTGINRKSRQSKQAFLEEELSCYELELDLLRRIGKKPYSKLISKLIKNCGAQTNRQFCPQILRYRIELDTIFGAKQSFKEQRARMLLLRMQYHFSSAKKLSKNSEELHNHKLNYIAWLYRGFK